MSMQREKPVVAMALLGIAVIFGSSSGCSDNGGSSGSMVEFPSVSMETLGTLCIRGEQSVPGQATGEIGADDCNDPSGGFSEAYRVRVQDSVNATFVVTSDLDSYLELYRVGDLSDYENSRVLLADDDDSSHGDDALLTHRLEPDTEYLIVVSGVPPFHTGPYTLDLKIVFPIISADVENALCIRGSLLVPGEVIGEIDAGDCIDPDDGFREAYRVRVNGEAAIAGFFDLFPSPSFVGALALYRVDDLSDYEASLVLLGSDPSLVEQSLAPGTEYVIFISGVDEIDLGTYELFLDDG